jgi:autotransporter-associated beta strand protein
VNRGTISGGTHGDGSGIALGVQFSGNSNALVNQGSGVINGGVEMTGSNNSVTLFTGSVISGALNMGADTQSLLALDGAGTSVFSSAVTGTTTFAGGLTKQGAGTWTIDRTLNAASVTISGGTLQVGNGGTTGSLGSGNITNNGTLAFNRSDNLTNTGVISGAGSLTKAGAGTWILSASNSYSGGTWITGGTLTAGNVSAFGTGAVTVGLNTFLDMANYSIANTLNNNGGTILNIGTISGGDFTGGTTDLSGDNSTVAEVTGTATVNVTGTDTTITNVAGGTLNVNAAGTTIQSYNGGNVAVRAGLAVTINDGTSSGTISGAGGLTKAGTGTMVLSGSNSFSGALTISGGIVSLANKAAVAGTSGVNLSDGTGLTYTGDAATIDRNISVTSGTGTIRNAGGGTLDLSGSLSKNGAVLTFAGGSFSITGVISGASANSDLVVDGAIVALDNTNTYNGPTYIRNAGALVANVVGAMPTNTRSAVIMDDTGTGSSALTNAASQQIASLTGAASSRVALGTDTSLTIGTSTGNTTFAGVISGSGGLIKDGASTQTLSGGNTYTGGTTISGGAVSVSADANLGAAPGTPTAGNVTLNGGKLIASSSFVLGFTRGFALGASGGTIEVVGGQSVSYGGIAAGSGALTKSGAGSLTLSGGNSYSGATTVSAGTLALANASGSALGSTASLNVASGATLLVSQSNQVNNNAAVTLSGGTITRGSGVTEVFGNLNLTQASFLNFGSGTAGNLTFGTYTPSALLTINNFAPGNTLVFGSDLRSTINNSSFFTFTNGGIGSSSWNEGTSTFTITAIPEPSTYVAALGLLALMLWPLRRSLRAKVS